MADENETYTTPTNTDHVYYGNSSSETKLRDWRISLVESPANEAAMKRCITKANIQYSAIETDHIANNAVTEAKIADDAVTVDKIADDAITADKIASAAVLGAKLGNGCPSFATTNCYVTIENKLYGQKTISFNTIDPYLIIPIREGYFLETIATEKPSEAVMLENLFSVEVIYDSANDNYTVTVISSEILSEKIVVTVPLLVIGYKVIPSTNS